MPARSPAPEPKAELEFEVEQLNVSLTSSSMRTADALVVVGC